MNRTVLMSGVSGYAGAAAAAALSAAGMKVLTTGRRPGADVPFDLLRPDLLAAQALAQGIDVLVHAAAVHEVGCRNDAVAAYTANVTATRALLEFAIASGARRLLYVSTFHVFGAPAGVIDESRPPQPANDYGLTHLLAEQVFLSLARRHGLAVNILRPANLFGTPVDWSSFGRWSLAPFDFVRQAVGQGEIVLRTDGAPIRNYVSLSHFGAGVLAAARGELPEVVHLTGQPWSMKALAQMAAEAVEQVSGRPVRVEVGAAGPAEAPFEFHSGSWAAESDANKEKMRTFLVDVARHLAGDKR